MIRAYIGIGGNLGDAKATVESGIAQLKHIPDSRLVSVSPLYVSKPMGPADQGDYVNAVAALDTGLSALVLLDQTQAIEQQHGRVRKEERWGPRTLDLDILLYGEQIIDNERLTIPHYGMTEREFVLYPLYDLQPDLQLPCGTLLAQLLEKIPLNGMQKTI